LGAILFLLQLMVGVALAGMPTKRPSPEERGKSLYQDNCFQCHGKKALGDGPLGRKLDGNVPPLAGQIKKAQFDETVPMILRGKGDMPGFNGIMDKHDAKRILSWLATLDPETGRSRKDKGETDDDDEDPKSPRNKKGETESEVDLSEGADQDADQQATQESDEESEPEAGPTAAKNDPVNSEKESEEDEADPVGKEADPVEEEVGEE
jgi:mono/diheme cytochrome c family protein